MLTKSLEGSTTRMVAGTLIACAAVLAAAPAGAVGGMPLAFVAKSAAQGNPNPGVIPNKGGIYSDLGAKWWQWAFSYTLADLPYLNTGGPVDISDGQSGHVWFLAGANNGLNEPRTGTVPTGTSLFFPLVNIINDYPCPPEFGFEPNPGESLEDFLQRTANEFFPPITDTSDLFAEVDGVPVTKLLSYRAMSPMFTFTADLSLSALDPCVNGQQEFGVALGYWLLLTPLTPGQHTIHFGAHSAGQDVTYDLTVVPGRAK